MKPFSLRAQRLTFAASLLALVLAACGGDDGDIDEAPAVRKSASSLSVQERQEFVKTLHQMKAMPSQYEPTLSAYDYFVDLHVRAFEDHTGAHMAPAFLPWHREYLRRFEEEMRRASGDPTIALPYWDWTDPEAVTRIFTDDFLGGDGDPDDLYFVKTGPFRKGAWTMAANYDDTDDEWDNDIDEEARLSPAGLQRRFDYAEEEASIPTAADVAELFLTPRLYDVAPYDPSADPSLSMRNYLEGFRLEPGQRGMHNAIHIWVGGDMQSSSSPNDPVFFLHHANVDRLWHQWQEKYGNSTYPTMSQTPHGDQEVLFLFGGITSEETFDLEVHSKVIYQ